MLRRGAIFLPVLFALCFPLFFCSCGKQEATSFAVYENIRAITLGPADMKHLLELAHSRLQNAALPKKADEFQEIYNPGARGVFISLLIPRERTITAFGFGDSLAGATTRAADLLRRLSDGEDLRKMRLRIDVVDTTTGKKDQKMGSSWHHDLTHEGLIINTDPVTAILPQEILGFEVITPEASYNLRGMKNLVKKRILGSVLREQLLEDSQVEYVRFRTRSFIEDEKGEAVALFGVNIQNVKATRENVLAALLAAGSYLKRNVDVRSGKFNYRYYPARDFDSGYYNDVRHAGALYSLLQMYELTRDEHVLEAAKSAQKWILDNIDGPAGKDKDAGADFLAYVDRSKKEAKTGGAALAIIALAKYAQVTDDRQFLPTMQGLARFIRFNIDKDGKLESKYYYDEKAHKPFDSSYYPGECILALVRLFQLDGDKLWIDSAQKMEDYLLAHRDGAATADSVIQDHWLAIALNELYPITQKKELLSHAFLIGDAIVKHQFTTAPEIDVTGGFSRKPASTPTSSRMEALNALQLLALREKDTERAKKYYDASVLAAQIILRMQFNETNSMFFPHPSRAIGGIMDNYKRSAIQIDYVQHAIGALTGLWEAMVRESGEDPKTFYGKLKLENSDDIWTPGRSSAPATAAKPAA